MRKGPLTKPSILHDKSTGEIRDTRSILQHNKGSLQKAHKQLKWRETLRNSTKIRSKTRLSALFIPIQYCT